MDEKYIPLSAAVQEFANCGSLFVHGEKGCKAIISRLQQIPPADVRPVERSTWKRIDPPGYGYVCGKCGRWEPRPEPFCNCGADMRPEPPEREVEE